MYNFLVKRGQAVAFGLGILIVLVFLIGTAGADGAIAASNYKDDPSGLNAVTNFNAGLYGAMVLLVIATAAALFFGLTQVFGNLKGSMKGLIGFAVLVLIFVIAYSTATVDTEGPIAEAAAKYGGISEGNMKFISGSIVTAGVLLATSLGAFVLFEIRNFFK